MGTGVEEASGDGVSDALEEEHVDDERDDAALNVPTEVADAVEAEVALVDVVAVADEDDVGETLGDKSADGVAGIVADTDAVEHVDAVALAVVVAVVEDVTVLDVVEVPDAAVDGLASALLVQLAKGVSVLAAVLDGPSDGDADDVVVAQMLGVVDIDVLVVPTAVGDEGPEGEGDADPPVDCVNELAAEPLAVDDAVVVVESE